MQVDKLKSKILQLAIQGKLVKQDENDEPAKILLEKITEEKERLIKEKKIKREKPMPEITKEEKAFELPKGWEWCRFSQVTICRDGERIPVSSKDRSEREKIYDYYGASGVIDKIDNYIFEKPLLLIGEDGANLISRSTPIAFIAKGKYWVNNHAHVIDSIDEITLKYLEIFVNAIDLKPYVTGTAQPKLNQANLNNIVLPLPSVAEQLRIVAKVDELFTIIDELSENKEAMLKNIFDTRNKVLQLAIQGKLVEQCEDDEPVAILLQRIAEEKERLIKEKKIKKEKPFPEITEEEKAFDIPNGWEWCRLGNIGDWGAGATPSRGNLSYYNGDICWIKTGELNDGFINGSEEKITEKALRECSLRLNKAGDVLIAMYGATIGKLGILNIEATTNQACCACTVFSQIYNKYLYVLLLAMRQEFKNQSFGGAQPNISKHKIINTVVALPPLEEQKRIVSKIDEIMSYLDELENTILERDIM